MPSVASIIRPLAIDDRNRELDFRAGLTALVMRAPTSAIAADGGLLPGGQNAEATSTGTSGAPKSTVAPYAAVIPSITSYGWIARHPASHVVDHDAPSPTNPRIDLIVARVTETDLLTETVTGTASATPAAPAAPLDSLVLWEVNVATSGALTYTDRRTWTVAAGGLRPSQGSTRDGGYVGEARTTAAGTVELWSGTAWVPVASPAVWSQETPTLQYAGNTLEGTSAPGTVSLGTGGSAICRYQRHGSTLRVRYQFTWGGTGWFGGTGAISTVLPASLSSSPSGSVRLQAHLMVAPNTVSNPSSIKFDYLGPCHINANGTHIWPMFAQSNIESRLGWYRIAVTTSVKNQSRPLISNGYAEGGTLNIWGEIEV